MNGPDGGKFVSAVFITFSGNCRKALTYYQTCFGGSLLFDTFDKALEGYTDLPVISGSLVSDRIVIYGSDLVHDEGRTLGNYLSIFLPCKNTSERLSLIDKLKSGRRSASVGDTDDQRLVEITDIFDVRWVLGI